LTRSGLLHYAAIANELAGLQMIRTNNDYWKEHYLLEAAWCYSEWGAVVKVDQMKIQHTTIDFINPSRQHRQASRLLRGLAQYNSSTDGISEKRLQTSFSTRSQEMLKIDRQSSQHLQPEFHSSNDSFTIPVSPQRGIHD